MRAIVGAVSTMLRAGRTSGMEDDREAILREAVNDGRGMLAGDFDEDSFDSVLRVLASDGARVARQQARFIRTRILRPAPAPAPTTTEAGGVEGGGRRADAEGGNARGRGGEGRGAGGSAEGADAGRPADVVTSSEAECCSSMEEWLQAIASAMAEARSAANAVRAAEFYEDAHPHHERGLRATRRVSGLLSGRVGRLVVPNAQGRFFASEIGGRSARDEWMEVNAMLSECPGKPRRR